MSYPPPGQPTPPPEQPTPQPGWAPPPTTPPAYGAPAYGAPTYGRRQIPGLASYGQRVGAYLIDYIVMAMLVVVAAVVLFAGPTEIVRCDLDEDGDVAIFDEDAVRPGLCEQPTGGTFAAAGGIGFLAVVFWFVYHAWEGATGKTLGKLAVGVRLVDQRTMQPIGGGKGIGRGVVEGLLGSVTCGIGGLIDLLWPLWDDDNQTVHDKAVSSVVVDADVLHSTGPGAVANPVTAPGAPPPQPGYGTAPPPPPPTASPPPGPPTAPPPGAPGSPTDPFGGSASGPPHI